MRQAKKIFTRMLINNWGGISHQIIHFHEHVNLFSGKSGSGKSTVMDAMQVVLYGSVRNDFLNKAADDTKNKRSVLSYLRGEQKDGSANRDGQDFYSQIVLEIQDTGTKRCVCVGVAFEVAKNDRELKNYRYFSHTGAFPEDAYLSEEKIPYSMGQIKQLLSERSGSGDGKSRVNLNRIYPSQDSYLTALNEVIFGYVDAGRFKTMQKSAIALRMANGTGQFIKDYMFPKSEEDTIAALSDQLAAYREIKEQVETLEQQIELLREVQVHDQALTNARVDQVHAEAFLRILEIEDEKAQLEAKEKDQQDILETIHMLEQQLEAFRKQLAEKREELTDVQAELRSSELTQKKEQLERLDQLIQMCSHEATDWRNLVKRLKEWEDTDGISDYVSNPLCHLLEEVAEGDLTEAKIESLKRQLNETYEAVTEELDDLKRDWKKTEADYQEKQDILKDLKSDKKHYKKELKEVRQRLERELSQRYGTTIHVDVLADLFDVVDEEWRDAIEGRLGRIKFGLVVEPAYALEAAKLFRTMKRPEYESVDVINTAAIKRDHPEAEEGTLYEAVASEIPYVDGCLKRYLGHIKKCDSVEELHEVRDGVTKDCYSYSNYMFRHLRKKDYQYASIGKKVSPKQIRTLEEELAVLSQELIRNQQEILTLQKVQDMERLHTYEYDRILHLSNAGKELKKYNQEADVLQAEIRELEKGTRIAHLQEQEKSLLQVISELETKKDQVQLSHSQYTERKGNLETEVSNRRAHLEELQEGFVPDEKLQEEASAAYYAGRAADMKWKQRELLENAIEKENSELELRGSARARFNRAFPSFGFGGMEQENTVYDELLERCERDFEPEYKAQFDQQYQLVYRMLRENVIATIHGEIRAAKRHRREINAMLAKIRFSDSIYQIDILPTDDENRQFYEMLTAEELDMKVSIRKQKDS